LSKQTACLGMNHSTAQQRLVKDTLFRLAVESGHKCYQCGGELTRETFSVEHKVPWLNEPNALELFFDQKNIGFSHIRCNLLAARRPHKKYFTDEQRREADNISNRACKARKRARR
jgi:hypothetical protein